MDKCERCRRKMTQDMLGNVRCVSCENALVGLRHFEQQETCPECGDKCFPADAYYDDIGSIGEIICDGCKTDFGGYKGDLDGNWKYIKPADWTKRYGFKHVDLRVHRITQAEQH